MEKQTKFLELFNKFDFWEIYKILNNQYFPDEETLESGMLNFLTVEPVNIHNKVDASFYRADGTPMLIYTETVPDTINRASVFLIDWNKLILAPISIQNNIKEIDVVVEFLRQVLAAGPSQENLEEVRAVVNLP